MRDYLNVTTWANRYGRPIKRNYWSPWRAYHNTFTIPIIIKFLLDVDSVNVDFFPKLATHNGESSQNYIAT